MAQICSGQTSYSNPNATLAVSATATRTGMSTVTITASWTIYTAGSSQTSGSDYRYLVLCNSSGTPIKYSAALDNGRGSWSSNTTYSGTITFTGVSASSTQTSLAIGFKVSASNTSVSSSGTLIWNGSKSTSTGSPDMQTGTVTFAVGTEPYCSARCTSDYSLTAFSVFANCTNAASVKAAVWTGSQQTDIRWYTLDSGSWTRDGVKYNYGKQITLSSHGGRTSYKNVHIYMYDSSNKAYFVGAINLYYAKTLQFDANGGECSVTSKSVTWGNALGELPTPTKTGHVFNGWYTASSGGTLCTSTTSCNFSLTESTHTLYAQWTIDTYTVSYDANGGTDAPSTQTKTYGTDLILSSITPIKVADSEEPYVVTLNANGGSVSTTSLSAARVYAFSEWNSEANGSGTSYDAGGSYTEDKDVTLYAQYADSISTLPVTLPTPVKEGLIFKGWATSSTALSGVTGSYVPSGNETLYAIWGIDSVSVFYHKDNTESNYVLKQYNGSVSETVEEIKSLRPIGKSLRGYRIQGTNTVIDLTTRIVDLPIVNNEVHLYCVWNNLKTIQLINDNLEILNAAVFVVDDSGKPQLSSVHVIS